MSNMQQFSQTISLHQAVGRMADEINNTLEHEYSKDENITILGASDSKHKNDHSSAANSSELNGIEADSSIHREMATYNSSNRLIDHQTRWNSR
jgi:hypothetical protein